MKKIIFTICVLFFTINNVFADENISNVFKVFTYKYDILNDTYYVYSQGSAVLLNNNTVITNAHVILDENNEPIKHYEICKTINFKDIPECFSVGNLQYYDISKDLALLKLDTDLDFKGVKISTRDIEIGDSITTYGYPANGGGTITFTTGKISGYDLGKYKIDADIDSGSSGGAAFDSEGKLIGITNSVVVGYTTSGRIIPLSDIKQFLAKKGQGIYFKDGVSENFRDFFHYINVSIGKSQIINKYFSLKNIKKNNFTVIDIVTSQQRDVFRYYLESNSGDTEISIKKNIALKTNITNNELYEFITKNIVKEKNIKFVYKEVTLKGRKVIISMFVDKITRTIEISFYGDGIDFNIKGTLNNTKELNSALKLFFNNYEIFDTINNPNNVLSIGGVKINNTENLALNYTIGGENDYLTFIGFLKTSQNTFGTITFQNYEFKADEIESDATMELMLQSLENYYNEFDTFSIIDSGLVKNTKGNVFGYTGVKSSEDNTVVYTIFSYNLFKETNQYSFFLLGFNEEDKNISKSIRSFIDVIEYEGETIIPVKNIVNIKTLKNIK